MARRPRRSRQPLLGASLRPRGAARARARARGGGGAGRRRARTRWCSPAAAPKPTIRRCAASRGPVAGLGDRARFGARGGAGCRRACRSTPRGGSICAALERELARARAGAGLGHARQQRDRRDPAGARGRRARPPPRRAACTATRSRRAASWRSTCAALGVDLLTLSAHKLGGPQGVGALVAARRARARRPAARRRPGAALAARHREPAGHRRLRARVRAGAWRTPTGGARTGALRDRLEARIAGAGAGCPGVRARRRAAAQHVSCLTMPGVSNQTQLIAFDLAGIAVSTGSACSSGKVGPSHVLAAMGIDPERGGERDPGQPGLGQHRRRRRSLRRRLESAVRPHAAAGHRRRRPGVRPPRLLLPPGSRHK